MLPVTALSQEPVETALSADTTDTLPAKTAAAAEDITEETVDDSLAPAENAPESVRETLPVQRAWISLPLSCDDPAGLLILDREKTRKHAARSWNDAVAALPPARADRFGPPGFFETFRIGGTGAPLVILDGVPWPREAGGLPNGNAMPDAGIGLFTITTPRILTGLALVAPDGAALLETEKWTGGRPFSYADALQGAGGYRQYRFGLSRDVTRRLEIQVNGRFLKADQYVLESYSSFSSDIRMAYHLRSGMTLRAGTRSYRDEQILIDPDLGKNEAMSGSAGDAVFSHDGTDERSLRFVEIIRGGMVGQWYSTRIKSNAVRRDISFSSIGVTEDRTGALLSGRIDRGRVRFNAALRYEARDVETDSGAREGWETRFAAGVRCSLSSRTDLNISLAEEVLDGGRDYANSEGVFVWKGRIPGLLRVSRLWERPTARDWASDSRPRDVIRAGEIGCAFPFLPAGPSIRCFVREGDSVKHLLSVDAFRESGERIDERTHGVEGSVRAERDRLKMEGSWMWSHARDRGDPALLPYHSDHVLRGRVSYEHGVRGIPFGPRWDLLGEWRSERYAPGRENRMEAYFYLRGRVTVSPRGGVELFAQLEQLTGHQLEYIDGWTTGADGALSGSQQIYFGLHWPFLD